MSTLRINNIEAQSIPASPTIDEKVKVTNSSGDILVNIDGKTSGITTIGINTTDGNIKFDANSNVLITGILTATTLAGNFTPDSLEVGSNIKLGNAGVITATNFKSGVTNVHNLGLTLTGGQLDVGSNIKIGTAGIVTATTFSGSGASLTNLPAANLTGTLPAISGANLTNLDASDLASGTVPTARLGSGTASSSTFLAGDSTYKTVTGTTINNNANDRVITGSSSANTLEGEANLTFETSTSGGTLTVAGTSEYQIKLKDSNTSGNGAETALAFTDSGNTVQGFVGFNYWGDGNLDIQNSNTGGSVCINTGGGNERLVVTSDGDIYGPSAGRKNWFDNGSFDCTYGGRKANTSMDYGNHHAYGWVTDRFMSRNSVQWSRSSNVPTGKGFSYSTYTNGAGGILMQAVELPDYGDMGVFAPSSYWCVSFWSTATCNPSAAAFSYDLGSTKTDMTDVAGGAYASTGETASGTSTGTFTRYYKVFQMPSSIISTATGAYWQWGFSQQGYATGWQLERVPTSTSKPTPYEHVHPSVTIARCRRYAYRKYNSRHVCGWKRHDSGISWEARHPVLPTHMPSGSNQSADPYGIHMHSAGTLTNFQSIWQNPAVTSLSRYGFNPADGSFIVNGQSNYSSAHLVIPSWESFEYEIQHGFF